MARPVHIPRRVSRHTERQLQIEVLRYNLPINTYLEVMHRAAAHGELLQYNPDGSIRSARACSPKEQLEAARYLIDKVMASRSPSPTPVDPDADLDDESLVRNLQMLPTDQLRRIIHDPCASTVHP